MRYYRALRAIKEVVAKSGRNTDEFPMHSLRIEGATALPAGAYPKETFLWEPAIQRERRSKSDAYKAFTRNNIEDSRRVSRKLVVASEGKERKSGEGTVWWGRE